MIRIFQIGDQIATSGGISATGPPFLRLTNELLKCGVSPAKPTEILRKDKLDAEFAEPAGGSRVEQRPTWPSPPRQVRRLQWWNMLSLLH
jgi:hypothetical protein